MPEYVLSTWIVANAPADEAVDHLAGSGFRLLELSADEAPLVKAWEADPVGVAGKLSSRDLTVASVHCPDPGRFLDLADERARLASIAADVQYMEWMQACAIPELVLHPTSRFSETPETACREIRDLSIDSLKRLADHAGRLGIRLAVENLGKPPTPASTIASILEMIDGLGAHVGVCHDIGHSVQAGLSFLSETRAALASGRLFCLHIHDVDAELRDHHVPGDGTLDFGPLLHELDAAGFSGGRTLEVSPPQSSLPERLAKVVATRKSWE